ncbi:hypothetical protein [Flavobacterium pectinovorum]|jgi:hypothetical protein|nr:hypothetical protein [Flavobacterium pectinovorum]
MRELDDDYQNSLEKLIEELQKSEEDIEAGRIIDYSDFKEKLRIRYNI